MAAKSYKQQKIERNRHVFPIIIILIVIVICLYLGYKISKYLETFLSHHFDTLYNKMLHSVPTRWKNWRWVVSSALSFRTTVLLQVMDYRATKCPEFLRLAGKQRLRSSPKLFSTPRDPKKSELFFFLQTCCLLQMEVSLDPVPDP